MTHNTPPRQEWTTGWIPGLPLALGAWSDPLRRTLQWSLTSGKATGSLAPINGDDWQFRIQAPPRFGTISVLHVCPGFVIRDASRTDDITVALLEDGLIIGECPVDVRPDIFSGLREAQDTAAGLVLELGEKRRVVLHLVQVNERYRFALCLTTAAPDHLGTVLEEALLVSPTDVLQRECSLRRSVYDGQPTSTLPARLVESVELLAARLRAPEQGIPSRWCASPTHNGGPDFNEWLLNVRAWLMVDPRVAKDIVRSALESRTTSGLLYRDLDGDTLALPVLARGTRDVWNCDHDEAFLVEILPLLHLWLSATIQTLDAHRTGRPCWTDQGSSLVPDLFEEQTPSLDLACLLHTECEALIELTNHQEAHVIDTAWLGIYAGRLADQIREWFWNPEANGWFERDIQGAFGRRKTLGSWLALPFARPGLKDPSSIAHDLSTRSGLMGADGVLGWEKWEKDPVEPAANPLYQLLALDALKSLPSLRAPLERHLFLLHAAITGQNDHAFPLEDHAGRAALTILSTCTPADGRNPRADVPRWLAVLDAHRKGVLIALTVLLAVVFFTIPIHLVARQKTQTASMMADLGLAKAKYMASQFDEAVEIYERLLKDPSAKTMQGDVLFMLGKAYWKKEDWAMAETYFSAAVAVETNAPQPLWNLAQTYFKQGRIEDMITTMRKFIEQFQETYPDQARMAVEAINLASDRKVSP